MSDFIDFLFSEAPWLRPTLAWGLGVLAVAVIVMLFVAVVVAPLAYFAWPFLNSVRQLIAGFVQDMARHFANGGKERARLLDEEADKFQNDGGLWRLSFKAEEQWSAELKRLSKVLKGLVKPIEKATAVLAAALNVLPQLIHSLQRLAAEEVQPFPAIPPPNDFADAIARYRVAWLRLVLSMMILAAITAVNTVMLSQILRDLGVIPAALAFFGIPLAYAVAFLMTGVEAGLGVGHSATVEPGKFSMWPYFYCALAFGVSLFEGSFWSRIAPAQGTLTLPFVGYEMQQSSLFFLFGFALVWTLFGLGAIVYDSAAKVLGGRRGDLLRSAIERLRSRYERYTRLLAKAMALVQEATAVLIELNQKIEEPAANASSVRDLLEKLRDEIDKRSQTTPDWAKDQERKLTQSEVYQLAQMGGLWLVLAIVGAVAMTIVAFEGFSNTMDAKLRWALAFGQAIAFYGVGALLGAGEVIVRRGPEEHERRVAAAPVLSRWFAYGIGGMLVAFFLVLVLTTARGTEWLVNLVLGLFLAAAGYHLNPLLNVVGLWQRRMWNSGVGAVQAAWLASVRVIQFVVVVLERVAYAFRRPKPPAQQPPVEDLHTLAHSASSSGE